MAEQWVAYMRASEEGPWSWMCDLQHRRRAEGDPKRPLLTIVQVGLREPGESGLGTTEECGRLDDAFEPAAQRMAAAGGVFVARARMGGGMSFCVYSPAASREQIERIAREAFQGEELDFQRSEDPTWKFYRNSMPTREEERTAMDAAVVHAMASQRDPLKPKRDVRHFAYFPTRESAEQFARAVGAEGFETEFGESEGKHSVLASRDDSVELEAIVPITAALSERAEAFGGEYDGWEAMLVKKKGLLGKLFG